ncbi:hypothetical protein [Paenibacillus elgii]|uniref:hypothetical protein n=1 Tax=Paenibacillus elgii TaxID=189691 RepID=UPI001F2A1E5D|nr:hypothetical protein [Paenibacillus elgii]
MFNVREHISSRSPRISQSVVEEWIERAERLISIEQALRRQLTETEKQTLCWLATYETSTVDNIQRIFDELVEIRGGGEKTMVESKQEGSIPETISYQKHHTGNFVVKYGEQEIIVLKDAFSKITGVSPEAALGSVEADRSQLRKLDFNVGGK